MEKSKVYMTKDICASCIGIKVDTETRKVLDVNIMGGCDGSHRGIVTLVKGMDIEEAANKLEGIGCGRRQTSCPDKLGKALRDMLSEISNKEKKDEDV